MKSIIYIAFFIFFSSFNIYAQKDSITANTKQLQLKPADYNPLSPSKAAFYSAIFPGAGQIYNNRYWWQLPLIYGGLGISIYSYIDSSNDYDRYRTAFKRRKAGLPDEFTVDGTPIISDAGLESAQRQLSKNRDLSLLSAILVYVLQIVEASVRAHLLQFDTNENLSISPMTIPDYDLVEAPKVGVTLKYSF
ncbi:hypothetical protein C7447_10769 [Tenacibaculum adriaticum]|uniref:DUF5683 domain-containing protein n=1 Tax=Tenacibaculum adriaticum TaxID=413713 RepID=A0A5S5DKN0_9FLAO|nr:DUF5683 domain-containing protein [Tenacibaculum adriaticum]TYP96503.1 hypothetical protein C7447_10769 [Tenacibaculum adriaticum]